MSRMKTETIHFILDTIEEEIRKCNQKINDLNTGSNGDAKKIHDKKEYFEKRKLINQNKLNEA